MNTEIEMKKSQINHENEVENYTTPSKPNNQNHNYNTPTLSHADDETTSDENCTGEDDEGSESISVTISLESQSTCSLVKNRDMNCHNIGIHITLLEYKLYFKTVYHIIFKK